LVRKERTTKEENSSSIIVEVNLNPLFIRNPNSYCSWFCQQLHWQL